MLTEYRTPGQSLRINDNVVVRVLEVNGNQVRIGVEASKNIEVDRMEIRERKLADRLGVVK